MLLLFIFWFWITSGNAQCFFWLCSWESLLAVAWGQHGILWIQPRLTACRARLLSTVQSFWSSDLFLMGGIKKMSSGCLCFLEKLNKTNTEFPYLLPGGSNGGLRKLESFQFAFILLFTWAGGGDRSLQSLTKANFNSWSGRVSTVDNLVMFVLGTLSLFSELPFLLHINLFVRYCLNVLMFPRPRPSCTSCSSIVSYPPLSSPLTYFLHSAL